MADYFSGLVDAWNRPIEKRLLTEEVAAATITGVRSPLTSYPADGLDPQGLAAMLREADAGNPVRYLELAETIEERDLHYAGVLGTRKRSVSQLEITVEPASEDKADVERADLVREWLKRDELADELTDMLDAVGKGYSFTEIVWDTSEGQWRPARLEWRDPRWFDFATIDGTTPQLIGENGERQALPGFKFIYCRIKAKSGLPVRSGIARIAAWAWMFKAFTQRDWAIFTQTYGQPVRLGKYGPGATADDRAKLYRAVANIAADCAAIIPESMAIEFVEAKNLGTGHANYKERADWLDQQISKGVLGQTATTDAIAGGHAVGREHRQVQEDIERADAKAISAIINRDLIAPWMALEWGARVRPPRLKIGRAEQTDVSRAVDAVVKLVPLGLRAGRKQMADLIGIGEPGEDDELLATPKAAPASDPAAEPPQPEPNAPRDKSRTVPASALPTAPSRPPPLTPADAIADGAIRDSARPVSVALDTLRAIVANASSLEEMMAAIEAAAGDLPEGDLQEIMKQAMLLAELTGRAEIGF